MIVTIKGGDNLLSVLNKNPETDYGLYLKPYRNGHLVGNVVDNNTYEVFFQDTKHSFTQYEDNQIDFKSYCSPEAILGICTELFAHLLKPIEEVLSSEISWLDKKVEEVNEPCTIHVTNFLINSNWYRDGQFLLSKYIKELGVAEKEGIGLFELIIKAPTVQAINILALTSFFGAVTNSNDFYLENSQIEKYARVLTNVKEVPYFVYYLFIKRCCIKSPKVFEKIKPVLEQAYNKYNDISIDFTTHDTQGDRMWFVRNNLDFEKPVLFYGCGEMKYERFMWRKFKKQGKVLRC